MGRQAKTIAGVAVIALVAAVVFLKVDALAGVGVLVAGVLAGVVVLRRTADGAGAGAGKGTRSKAETPLDLIGETSLPLTSSPAAPLPTWTPPSQLAGGQAAARETERDDASQSWGSDQSWDSGPSWDEGDRWSNGEVALDRNPLDALDRLDEVDVVAEVERIEARGALLDEFTEDLQPVSTEDLQPVSIQDRVGNDGLASPVVSPINENVSSADDIMAASQATELTVVAPAATDNSELAKLLAKVQARLAAYE
ncbi:hypothetical protein [Rhabdothermincola sediminis]|uniref:hypothetical protein n=1 Tax=Rhabdothermincola sediminis TaxID=2751370 RepID=UPI001AA0913A|nr:hypothetical protein [Rhabdothermincola sediminis]